MQTLNNNPNFTQRIYSHYNLQVQPGSELGVVVITPVPQGVGGGSGNLGGSSTGTGAAGNAPAAANPNYFPQQGNGGYQQEYGTGSIQQQ